MPDTIFSLSVAFCASFKRISLKTRKCHFFSILRKGAFFTFLNFFYKSVFNTSKTTYQGIISIKKMIFKNYQKFCLKCVFLEILICDFSAVLAWGHSFLLQNWFLLRPQVARSAQFGWRLQLSEIFRNFQKFSETFRNFQKFSEIFKNFQKLSEIFCFKTDFYYVRRLLGPRSLVGVYGLKRKPPKSVLIVFWSEIEFWNLQFNMHTLI